MNIESTRKFEGLNIDNTSKAFSDKKTPYDRLSHFYEIEYTSKNDGKTYIAKKITLKQMDKEVTGIYVYDKSAKPDQNGNIQGVFMNYDTFMKHLENELQPVGFNLMNSYYPNINCSKMNNPEIPEEDDESYPLEPGVELIEAMKDGIALSDGSVLLRPWMQTVSSEIDKNDDGTYTVKLTPVIPGAKTEVKVLTEDELKSSIAYFGSIKESDDGTVTVDYRDKGQRKEKSFADIYEAALFLETNFIYVVE